MQLLSQSGAEIARANGIPTPPNPVFVKLMAASVGGLLVLAAAAVFIGVLI